ncbi:hypothetical protein [Variovorax saccharolyticus]|uniref:hypothetical protein n=1 Tax=Variovorax saccharolyticus TaxID=3053516 RepID=UPI00257768FA|nr:hypothetical protein [Variovorax sp. J22R187]MDM0022097.1 hypothetical protein [Variovorax sp. J22R187]
MRDDDMLSIVGSKKDPFISLTSISPSAARNAAARFSDVAERCLVDVRDKGISYERSSFCLAASSLHIDYLNVDQHQHWVNTTRVPRHAYDVALARGVLWSAVMISNERYGSKRTSLW